MFDSDVKDITTHQIKHITTLLREANTFDDIWYMDDDLPEDTILKLRHVRPLTNKKNKTELYVIQPHDYDTVTKLTSDNMMFQDRMNDNIFKVGYFYDGFGNKDPEATSGYGRERWFLVTPSLETFLLSFIESRKNINRKMLSNGASDHAYNFGLEYNYINSENYDSDNFDFEDVSNYNHEQPMEPVILKGSYRHPYLSLKDANNAISDILSNKTYSMGVNVYYKKGGPHHKYKTTLYKKIIDNKGFVTREIEIVD
jgi:hypothetical protein